MATKSKTTLASIITGISLLSCKSEQSKRIEPLPFTSTVQISLMDTKPENSCPNPPRWKSNSQIGKVVKDTINNHFKDDIKEMYIILGVPPRALPPIKFEIGKGPNRGSCEGGVYDFDKDEITFKLTCVDPFTKHVDYYNQNRK